MLLGLNTSTIPRRMPIPLNEVASSTGVPVREINRLIDDGFLPKSAIVESGDHRAVRAFAVSMVAFAASNAPNLNRELRREALRVIEKFVKEHWNRLNLTCPQIYSHS